VDLTFDESLFNKIIVVLVIAIVIVGAVAALRFSGLLGGDRDVPGPGQVPGEPGSEPSYGPDEPEEVVTGLKSYNWSYRGSRMAIDLYISNATYQRYLSSSYGTYEEKPERMAEYVVTDGDDGLIATLADWFLETSLALGYGDSETVGNVLAFVESLNYTTDEERRGTGAYPNYPVITLAIGGRRQ
jgi:putative intracellular protease/amidase